MAIVAAQLTGSDAAVRTTLKWVDPVGVAVATLRLVLTEDKTLANPIDPSVDMEFVLVITQDVVGGRALVFDTNYDFGVDGVPNVAGMAAGESMAIDFVVVNATQIACSVA